MHPKLGQRLIGLNGRCGRVKAQHVAPRQRIRRELVLGYFLPMKRTRRVKARPCPPEKAPKLGGELLTVRLGASGALFRVWNRRSIPNWGTRAVCKANHGSLLGCRLLVRNCRPSGLSGVFVRRLRPYRPCLWRIPGYRSFPRCERETATYRLLTRLQTSGRQRW